jgi:hypothetical protein
MLNIKYIKILFITFSVLLFVLSCVKENKPPDCRKPANPTVQNQIKINEGDTIRLTASGVKDATYTWTGPNNFYSSLQNPSLNNVNFTQAGKYWVKARTGYCYSDSVATEVFIKSDSTCRLADNWGNFENSGKGPFFMVTNCIVASGGQYSISSRNQDSTILINIIFKNKPVANGVYSLTNNPNPGNGQVYYKITINPGNASFYANTYPAFVKVANGKINVVVCGANFQNLGIFDANISCK